MQILQSTFLALLLAHQIADFPLQSNWIVRNKGGWLSAQVYHGLMHWALAWICLHYFAAACFLSWRAQALVAGYITAHLLIDGLKTWLTGIEILGDDTMAFSVDQATHVLTLAIAAFVLTGSDPRLLTQAVALSPTGRMHLLEIAIIYLVVIFTGGYLIRHLIKSFRSTMGNVASSGDSATRPELKNAGLYIGYLERFLVLTAILAQSATLVGLILTVKSIARFPEFKESSFAEYFLIGTLLSVSLAMLGGLLLQKLLYGSIAFK